VVVVGGDKVRTFVFVTELFINQKKNHIIWYTEQRQIRLQMGEAAMLLVGYVKDYCMLIT
jgi:hypothetical protein